MMDLYDFYCSIDGFVSLCSTGHNYAKDLVVGEGDSHRTISCLSLEARIVI